MTQEEIKQTAVKCTKPFQYLDTAVRELKKAKQNGENIYIEFSGEKLYSLIDDENSCYVKVTGKSKVDFFKGIAARNIQKINKRIEKSCNIV